MNLLFLVHAHTDFSKGGAENAAFAMHKYFETLENYSSTILCAIPIHLTHAPSVNSISKYSENEYLTGTECDGFYQQNLWPLEFANSLKEFIQYINPDIIHIHHFVNFGIDVILTLKSISEAKIIVTLHEYIALCQHNGQMIKLDGKLCTKSSPTSCSNCYDLEKNEEDNFLYSDNHFFTRKLNFSSNLKVADAVISPSNFLARRYKDNGYQLPFHIIENGLPEVMTRQNRESFKNNHSSNLTRFGYFGQINPYKGVLELMKNAEHLLLKHSENKKITIDIYGGSLEHQNEDFLYQFNKYCDKLKDIVTYHGPYNQTDISNLMSQIDWVIVPSIWWENSPIVIQEALYHYRPILGTSIGGIEEKIEGKGGILIDNIEDGVSLAYKIMNCTENTKLHKSLVNEIDSNVKVADIKRCCDLHAELYNKLLPGNA